MSHPLVTLGRVSGLLDVHRRIYFIFYFLTRHFFLVPFRVYEDHSGVRPRFECRLAADLRRFVICPFNCRICSPRSLARCVPIVSNFYGHAVITAASVARHFALLSSFPYLPPPLFFILNVAYTPARSPNSPDFHLPPIVTLSDAAGTSCPSKKP